VTITVRVQVGTDTAEEQGAEQVSEVFVLERDQLTTASVGLSLTEAHTLLTSIQDIWSKLLVQGQQTRWRRADQLTNPSTVA